MAITGSRKCRNASFSGSRNSQNGQQIVYPLIKLSIPHTTQYDHCQTPNLCHVCWYLNTDQVLGCIRQTSMAMVNMLAITLSFSDNFLAYLSLHPIDSSFT